MPSKRARVLPKRNQEKPHPLCGETLMAGRGIWSQHAGSGMGADDGNRHLLQLAVWL
jgi:hypothetical protein